MEIINSKLIGTGACIPDFVLTNAMLEKMVDTNDEWIVQRTGVRERRIARNTATWELALGAAQNALLPIIERAYQNGTIIVVCSQCSQGTVSLGTYASSAALHEVGAVNGHDMTTEAAFAKLYYLLSRSDDAEWVKAQLGHDLRGELTE